MKLVKEHIFEKFVEDSDPIHDMGIGLKFKTYEDAGKYAVKHFNYITDIKNYNPEKKYSKEVKEKIMQKLKHWLHNNAKITDDHNKKYYYDHFWLEISEIFSIFIDVTRAAEHVDRYLPEITRFHRYTDDPKDDDMLHPNLIAKIQKWYDNNKCLIISIENQYVYNEETEEDFWEEITVCAMNS